MSDVYVVDGQLSLGLLISFPLWIGSMLACYAANTALQAWKRCVVPFVVSAAIHNRLYSGRRNFLQQRISS